MEGITRIETGVPMNITIGQDIANIGKSAERPNILRNPNIGWNRNVDRPFFDTTAFQLPQAFTYGNAAPYIVDSDGRNSWDLAMQKNFRLHEKHTLQFRTEFFNLPNHVKFFGSIPSSATTLTSSSFGKPTNATSARQIQFGLRYAF